MRFYIYTIDVCIYVCVLFNLDEAMILGDQRGGDLQLPKNISAREEALRTLEESSQPLDLLKVVDAELEAPFIP